MEMDRRSRKADVQSMTEVEQDSPNLRDIPIAGSNSALIYSTAWKRKGPGGCRALRIGSGGIGI